ncbi:hypothetical protein SDC9_172162 [bioreactor metagenome]|uniref:Uncharacterized protein n=1 Tax=bioreactor metagenome TaxID=1076179 RepID=A0A645GF82_9ZZZZ
MFAVVAQQHRAIPDFKGNGVKPGLRHLAGDEAGIDQLIKLILVIRQILLDTVGGSRGIRRPDRFVSVLRAAAAFIYVGFGREEVFAVLVPDGSAGRGQRFVTDPHRIGTDIADQALRAFLAQIHPFIKALNHLHGLGDGEV